MKTIKKQSISKEPNIHSPINHNKKVLIPLLLLGLVLVFSIGIGDVSATSAGSDNISVSLNNSTNSSSNNSQTGPDPDVISGWWVVYSTNSIQDAINHAQTGDTIRLENGATFNEHDLTIPGTITNLTFDVWNASHTGPGGTATIDAQHLGRIISINSGVTVNFNNITFINGITSGDGGAIYNQGTITITNCTFLSNHASNRGGAICNIGSGSCTVTGSTFFGNSASGGANAYGGAINNHDITAILNVNNCTFTDNIATGSDLSVGAIENWYGTSTVTNCTFTGNTGTDGSGAVDNWYGTLTVTSCTFTGNTGSTGNGGAISNNGALTAHFNRFIGNTASQGSAIYSTSGTADISKNWWGSNTDPTTIPNLIVGTVNVDPWLVLTVTASPDTITSNSTSTVTADLQHDNHGTLYDPVLDGHVPDGISITFNPPSAGSYILPLPTVLTNGQAQVTYSSQNLQPGQVTVSASVDTETQQDNIHIHGVVTNLRTLEEFNTIQAAINDSDTINGDTLQVDPVTLHEDNILIWKNNLTILGSGSLQSIIDADNSGRIFFMNYGAGINFTLSNLILRNGNSSEASGGAIYDDNGIGVHSTLNITNCTFENNHAGNWGGAIYAYNVNLNISNSDFTNNSASYYGGAIVFGGDSTVIMNATNSYFNSNSAYKGGALFIQDPCTINITGSTFTNNHATDGGAIYGGGISGGSVNIENTIFQYNNGTRYGGAIWNDCPLTITGCTFLSNTSSQGGAIWNLYGDATSRIVKFNRIIGNNPTNCEIYCQSGTVDATLNWWGSNSSPSGKIFTIGGTILYDPWIILTITTNPTTINYLGTSQITADLLHDSSLGHPYHDPGLGHVPDGILITFTNPSWGSITNINPITSTTINGKVEATYHGNGALPIPLTPVQVYAIADSEQNTYTEINIIKPTTTTVNNVNGKAGQTVNLTANVNDNSGRPVNEGTVQFTVGSEPPFTATVIGGIATYTNWPVPAAWTTGNHPIIANYQGTGNYAASTGTGNLYLDPQADVNVTKVVNPGNANTNVGQSFNYTIIASNSGPDTATGVQITDLIPTDLIFNNYTSSQGTYNSSTGIWDIGTIANGANAWINLNVTVKPSAAGKTIANTATKTRENEYDPTPDSSTAYIYVPKADIAVNKTISNPSPNVGDSFNYTVTATNNGPDTATGVSVYDFISGVLTVNSVNTSQGTYNPTTRLWTIGALANGASATMLINVTVKSSAAGHYIVNTAYKYAEDQYDPTTTDDKTTINTYVNPTAWTVTISQLETAATYVKTYYETHSSTLPANVKIGYDTINMPQLLQLLVTGTLNINNGNLNPINVPNVNNPTSPSGTNTPGNLQKNEYITVASNIQNFINTNGRAPNYASSSLGNINYTKLVYTYSKIINFYQTNSRLPNYVTI